MARYNSGVGTGEGDDAVISFVFDEHENVAEWVKARLPMIRNGFGPCAAIGIMRNGLAIAGVVYHEYRGWDMQLSMAADSPYWCSRRTLNILLGYPFNQLHVARITACTAQGNNPPPSARSHPPVVASHSPCIPDDEPMNTGAPQ